MSGSSMNTTFDDDILVNASSIFLSTLVQEASTTTSRPPYGPSTNPTTSTTMSSSTTTTPSPTTLIQRVGQLITTSTYNFTEFMDSNGTWPDPYPGGNGTDTPTTRRTPIHFYNNLSNLDLIWIVPILILIILFLFALGFLLFYCIQRTELCILRYCRCCLRCCKCCSKTSYLLRDEHAKLTDDDTNVLYMREMRTGRSRP